MISDLSRRFEVPGFSLAWDVWGDAEGPPLVLVHGYTGSVLDFALVIEELARDRRVFAIDHRGHGRSSQSGDPETYTVDHIVDDLLAFTHEVVAPHDEPFDLLGHSMGGRVALRYALARRDLVHSLILMDTTAYEFGFDDPAIRATALEYFRSLTPAAELTGPAPGPEDALVEAAVPAEWLAAKTALQRGMDPMAVRALGIALFENHLTPVDHQLGDIDAPTTVIAGEHDHPYVDHAPRLASELHHAEFVVIDGAYHSPQLTHRAAWLAAVEAHLARAGS